MPRDLTREAMHQINQELDRIERWFHIYQAVMEDVWPGWRGDAFRMVKGNLLPGYFLRIQGAR